ncbi:MAG TPA: hypothetical protein VE844_15685, partial [Gammaproteobacteria bacterium]|nr:hypothetical protein [Gammaproteobacteria bacterium]
MASRGPTTAADKTQSWVMSISKPARPWHGLVRHLCVSLDHRIYLQREERECSCGRDYTPIHFDGDTSLEQIHGE